SLLRKHTDSQTSKSKKYRGGLNMAKSCRQRMMMLLSCCLVCLVALAVGSGTAHAALSCNSCHGMPPLDSPVRSPSTGAFSGNHQTHQPGNATASDCATC